MITSRKYSDAPTILIEDVESSIISKQSFVKNNLLPRGFFLEGEFSKYSFSPGGIWVLYPKPLDVDESPLSNLFPVIMPLGKWVGDSSSDDNIVITSVLPR